MPQDPGGLCTFPTAAPLRNSPVLTSPRLPPLEFIPVYHSLVHTKGPHNQICKKSRNYSLQQAPYQDYSFLTPF